MGRRVPGWAGFIAAPVVVFLTICSYYAYTRHYRTVSGNATSSPVDSAALQQSTDPQALLGIADHFYWLITDPQQRRFMPEPRICSQSEAIRGTNFTPR